MTMHEGQLCPTPADVERLVAAQHPRLAGPVRAVESAGTVNAIFRIGDDLVVRLPLVPTPLDDARAERAREIDAATRLLTTTTVATPEPVALGEPGDGYPMPWAVYRWLPGRPAEQTDDAGLAEDVARFVREVRAMPTDGLTFAGGGRGGDLAAHDEHVRRAIERSGHLVDAVALAHLWPALRDLPRSEPDRWAHNDLMPGNLLVRGGRLAAVIDVGTLQVADPAVDLQPAWNLFGPRARAAFREATGSDELAWERGRAWALVQAVGCGWYYERTNAAMSRLAVRTLEAVLDAR